LTDWTGNSASSPASGSGTMPDGWQAYRRLLVYVRPHRGLFALAVLGMAVAAVGDVGFAALMKPLLDGSFVARDSRLVAWAPAVMVALFLVRAAADWVAQVGLAVVARRVVETLRGELFDHLLRLPMTFFDHHATGELLAKLTFEVEQVAQASTRVLTLLVRDGLTVIGLLAWMLWLNPVLAAFMLVAAPVVALIVVALSKQFRRISRGLQEGMGALTRVAEEALAAMRIVRLYGGEAMERAAFAEERRRQRHLQVRLTGMSALGQQLTQLVVVLALAGMIALATSQAVLERISVGGFVSFLTAAVMLLSPLRRLTGINVELQRGLAAAQALFGLLDVPPERDAGQERLHPVRGALAFEQVWLRYPGREQPALAGISLRIEPGETVALVGRSGSGKSSLVALLPRFYDPDSGRITLDGHDLRDLPLAELRAQLAYVTQEAVLFNGTVRSNMAYGQSGNSDEAEVWAALTEAGAAEFVRELPQGLDSAIGERGVMLSGGQRQRLAIARALLRQAPVLILDEATAALDMATERAVQHALELRAGRQTKLVIAHRLTTVERADRIVVLEAGQVVEQGTHAELLAAAGAYAALYRLQFRDA